MFNNFDPSKMDPKLLMQMSELVRQLPPDKLNKMQSLMHNMMAGFDVQKDLEEFERGLPPGFREKLLAIIGQNPSAFMGGMGPGMGADAGSAPGGATIQPPSVSMTGATQAESVAPPANLREARLTILRAVADGRMSPDEAEKLLFSET
jgi:hypothetical protein